MILGRAMIPMILMVFSFVVFVLGAVFPEPMVKRFVAAGLAGWVLAEIFLRSGLFGK